MPDQWERITPQIEADFRNRLHRFMNEWVSLGIICHPDAPEFAELLRRAGDSMPAVVEVVRRMEKDEVCRSHFRYLSGRCPRRLFRHSISSSDTSPPPA